MYICVILHTLGLSSKKQTVERKVGPGLNKFKIKSNLAHCSHAFVDKHITHFVGVKLFNFGGCGGRGGGSSGGSGTLM